MVRRGGKALRYQVSAQSAPGRLPLSATVVGLTVRPEPVEGSCRTRTRLRQAQSDRTWHLTEPYGPDAADPRGTYTLPMQGERAAPGQQKL